MRINTDETLINIGVCPLSPTAITLLVAKITLLVADFTSSAHGTNQWNILSLRMSDAHCDGFQALARGSVHIR